MAPAQCLNIVQTDLRLLQLFISNLKTELCVAEAKGNALVSMHVDVSWPERRAKGARKELHAYMQK